MASVKDSKVIIKNAQALELFMRVSSIMPLFIEHFKVDKNNSSRLLFGYEITETDDPSAAIMCETHMQQLKSFLSIDPKKLNDVDGLYYDINLADSTLKDKVLDLTARLINAAQEKDHTYTLSYFPTRENAPKDYEGLMDSDKLYDTLSRGLPEKVNKKYLQDLLPEMNHLAGMVRKAKFPEPHR